MINEKLDNIRLCQTFISNLRTGGVEVTGYSMAEQVTYRYYMGRFQFYQNNLKKVGYLSVWKFLYAYFIFLGRRTLYFCISTLSRENVA